ncbi:hypothetical protein F444_02935 [Phytophthora nicotianae P1976]|uniref:SAP domain-containing protein n=1 Tax=Phytophthora nicotianae P1976 TaxID=1317066 RepID=A0A081AVS5_PHYNI|nr:hypothetical protein F444_02935 [Phytophthora nicotianae P1976]
MLSLSELKDALTALGESTATGKLRGEARRDELVKRLHQVRVASGLVVGNTDDKDVVVGTQALDKLPLSELRSVLELRNISTQTPGLKGEARRHALIQRLMNTFKKLESQSGRINFDTSLESVSGRTGSNDDEADETKSETNSSVYSSASEFIFYNSVNIERDSRPELQPKANALTPQLSFTKLKKEAIDAQIDSKSTEFSDDRVEHLQRELFDLRTKLHTARQEQQRLVDQSLQKAGIQLSLCEISAKLQALERERRRLQENYYGHELVTCDVLTSTNNNHVSLELMQEDAMLLIEKHQEALKCLAERTKEAMAVAKFHAVEIESGIATSARQEEDKLLRRIGQIESSLGSTTASPALNNSSETKFGSKSPFLTRCRTMPNGRHPPPWDRMDIGKQRKLIDLQSAVSFHIRRDRVTLGSVLTTARVPTQTHELGMKEQLLEKAKCNVEEIRVSKSQKT